jgi:hypothetical protein
VVDSQSVVYSVSKDSTLKIWIVGRSEPSQPELSVHLPGKWGTGVGYSGDKFFTCGPEALVAWDLVSAIHKSLLIY